MDLASVANWAQILGFFLSIAALLLGYDAERRVKKIKNAQNNIFINTGVINTKQGFRMSNKAEVEFDET